MPDQVIWCNCCREVFTLPEESEKPGVLKCPSCEATGVVLLESRKLDTGQNNGPAPWEYICRACALYFEVPSPADPDETERIACPRCGGRDLERLHVCSLENMGHSCFG